MGQAQGLVFQPVDGRPVDSVPAVEVTARSGQGLDPGPVRRVEGGQLGHVLDAQVQRVAEHPAGVVGAGLGRQGGVQRVEQGERGPRGWRPAARPGRRGRRCPSWPRSGPRTRRPQARPPPPRPAGRRPGRDHQGGGAGPALDPVPGSAAGHPAAGRQRPLLARLQDQGGRRTWRRRPARPVAGRATRPAARPPVRGAAHGRQHRLEGRPRDLVALAAGVGEAGGDPARLGGSAELVEHHVRRLRHTDLHHDHLLRSMTAAPEPVWPGQPRPLGATWDGEGTNFAVFAEGPKPSTWPCSTRPGSSGCRACPR